MASKVQFLLGFSFKLDNVNTLYSTSCFLVPILSNSILILVWPASRCSTQAHCQSETNERCVICQQTASRQSRDSQLRELTKILTLQHPALFQHLPWKRYNRIRKQISNEVTPHRLAKWARQLNGSQAGTAKRTKMATYLGTTLSRHLLQTSR